MIVNRVYLMPSGRPARFDFSTASESTFTYVDREGGTVGLLPSFAASNCALISAVQ